MLPQSEFLPLPRQFDDRITMSRPELADMLACSRPRIKHISGESSTVVIPVVASAELSRPRLLPGQEGWRAMA